MNKLSLLTPILLLVPLSQVHGSSIYATSVLDHSPTATPEQDPSSVLGEPDEITADFAAAGPGEYGFVQVAFDDQLIVDGPGDDIFVHLFGDWESGEGFHVDVSLYPDGPFTLLESFHTSFSQNGSVVLGCDLADLSLTETRYVRITNSTSESPAYEGPEIDAISANVPEPASIVILALGVAGATLRRRI